jgi:hypothetical protein
VTDERADFIRQETEDAARGERAAPKGTDIRFRFTRFRDIELGTAPPYTVHGIIPRLGVVVAWGKPKCGKTFWIFDLEMHIALGWPYRGRHVEQGEVLHIACEGVAGIGARKEAWLRHHLEGIDEDAAQEIWDAPFHLCKDTALDLIEDVDQVINDIVAQFSGRLIKVITIDTLNRSLKGSESNDDDMAAYVRAATLLAEHFQCVVIIIHHCGHNEARPRGHSSLLGAVDALIEVSKDAEGRVCTEVDEMRDGPTGARTASRLEVIEVTRDDNGDPITSCVIVPDDAEQPSKAKSKPAKPPTPLARKFYDALINAGAKQAQPREASGNRPSITEEQWTGELLQRGLVEVIPDDTNKATRQSAQNRRSALISKCRRELVAADWIACSGKILWSVKPEQ